MLEISEKIKKIIEEFYNQNWDLKDFLTEDDVRCRLFVNLQQALSSEENIGIHSEIRWYGGNPNGRQKLKYRSDLVIIDEIDLQTTDKILPLPSKGYGFNKYYAIIEIKLRRPNDKNSDNKYNQIIQRDIDKLKEIKERTAQYSDTTNKKFFVIAFDKKRNRKLLYNLDINSSIDWDTCNF